MSKITFYRGDSYPIEVALTNAANKPIDITGYSFVLTVHTKKDPTSEPALFTVSGNIVSASGGKIEFTPTSANTGLAPGEYWYDISMSQAPSYKRTIVKDIFQIVQDITKT
jgi:hypothetical protein